MNKTLAELAARFGVTEGTMRIYLGRAEFAHIYRVMNKKKKRCELTGIERWDIDRLAALIYGRRNNKKRKQND